MLVTGQDGTTSHANTQSRRSDCCLLNRRVCRSSPNCSRKRGGGKNHVGATVTVCGKAASTRFVSGSKGQPTFLNLDKPHPKEIFTIVIWGTDRPKFGKPEDTYRNKDICVTGRITSHKSVPQVIIGAPSQIQTQK